MVGDLNPGTSSEKGKAPPNIQTTTAEMRGGCIVVGKLRKVTGEAHWCRLAGLVSAVSVVFGPPTQTEF